MSALGACGASPLPSPVAPADSPPATIQDSAGARAPGADAAGAAADQGAGDPATSSFQKMMSQAQDAGAARAGNEPAAAAAALAAAAGTMESIVIDTVVGAVATTASAIPDPLAKLLQLSGLGEDAGNTSAATPVVATTLKKSASDADAMPQDDSLALVLSALSQLGITLQPATPAAIVATDGGTALAVAADGAAAQLAGTLAKPASGPIDTLAARLRAGPALTPAVAANDAATGNTALAGSLMQADPTVASVTLRDLLDGSGGDAASRMRDPAETAASARAAEAVGQLATAANDSSRPADAVTRTISIPVQHPRWADAVATEIRWFAEQGVQGATLRLTPEHLGPVEVRLSLSDNQVTVNFSAASAETRTALEQSLPRLREMLGSAGLSLGEAQVQQQMRQGSQNGFNSGGSAADTDVRDSLARVPMRLGLVDEYA